MVKPRARELFASDLNSAKIPSRFPDIVDVKQGGLGDSIDFTYVSSGLPRGQVTIQALVPGMLLSTSQVHELHVLAERRTLRLSQISRLHALYT